MCGFSKPKTPKAVPSIVPKAPEQPEKAPEPVEIKKDGQTKLKRKRNPLRIDLATQQIGSANTGVNI